MKRATPELSSIDELMKNASIAHSEKNYDKGITFLEQVLELEPENNGAKMHITILYIELASALINHKQYEAAEELCNQALKYSQSDICTFERLSVINLNLGTQAAKQNPPQQEQAIKYFQKSLGYLENIKTQCKNYPRIEVNFAHVILNLFVCAQNTEQRTSYMKLFVKYFEQVLVLTPSSADVDLFKATFTTLSTLRTQTLTRKQYKAHDEILTLQLECFIKLLQLNAKDLRPIYIIIDGLIRADNTPLSSMRILASKCSMALKIPPQNHVVLFFKMKAAVRCALTFSKNKAYKNTIAYCDTVLNSYHYRDTALNMDVQSSTFVRRFCVPELHISTNCLLELMRETNQEFKLSIYKNLVECRAKSAMISSHILTLMYDNGMDTKSAQKAILSSSDLQLYLDRFTDAEVQKALSSLHTLLISSNVVTSLKIWCGSNDSIISQFIQDNAHIWKSITYIWCDVQVNVNDLPKDEAHSHIITLQSNGNRIRSVDGIEKTRDDLIEKQSKGPLSAKECLKTLSLDQLSFLCAPDSFVDSWYKLSNFLNIDGVRLSVKILLCCSAHDWSNTIGIADKPNKNDAFIPIELIELLMDVFPPNALRRLAQESADYLR